MFSWRLMINLEVLEGEKDGLPVAEISWKAEVHLLDDGGVLFFEHWV